MGKQNGKNSWEQLPNQRPAAFIWNNKKQWLENSNRDSIKTHNLKQKPPPEGYPAKEPKMNAKEQIELNQAHQNIFQYEQEVFNKYKDSGCHCRLTMTNAGTSAMRIDEEANSCPKHGRYAHTERKIFVQY